MFAVVFHGDATLAVLNDDAYSAKFNTKGNPNLDLLHQLHEQGVELFVCGQTLISKDAKPEEVAVFVDTAVSALTVVVNLQADGYAHVPSGNFLRHDSRHSTHERARYNQVKYARQCCGLGGCRQIHIAAPEVFECLSDRRL